MNTVPSTMIDPAALWQLVPKLGDRRVLVVGDLMLDRFITGSMERISPEAPVPVLRHEAEAAMLGGAGNVAANICSLNGRPILVGLIGADAEGDEIRSLCAAAGIDGTRLIRSTRRPTSLKTRFIAKGQQVLRYDREESFAIDAEERVRLEEAAVAALDETDIVILSDYAKGTLLDGVSSWLIEQARARGLPIVVDPKGRDYRPYAGATVIKPNLRELGDVTGQKLSDDASIVTAATTLREALGIAAMVVSRGAAGISVIDAAGPVHVPAVAREVFDEAGAGDTVVAVLALGIAAGLELATSARLANAAAGVVVAKRGTAQVTPSELIEALTGRERTSAAARSAGTVVERDLIRQVVESWRFDGYRVGFTNGCFDILHPGHVALLEAARATCDRLVVGLNSDASVGRLKGPERPINDQDARAHVLAAVGAVDAVVIFDEDTPSELIEALMPDVLVKGADYTIEQVVGARFVLAYGGRVELVPLVSGRSTSNIVSAIRKTEPNTEDPCRDAKRG